MSYFARFFPDESNRKKSIKTTQMTGLYKGFGHVLQKASIEEISFSDNQLGEISRVIVLLDHQFGINVRASPIVIVGETITSG